MSISIISHNRVMRIFHKYYHTSCAHIQINVGELFIRRCMLNYVVTPVSYVPTYSGVLCSRKVTVQLLMRVVKLKLAIQKYVGLILTGHTVIFQYSS